MSETVAGRAGENSCNICTPAIHGGRLPSPSLHGCIHGVFHQHTSASYFLQILRNPGLLPWDALKARLEAKDVVRAVCLDVIPGLQNLIRNGAVSKVQPAIRPERQCIGPADPVGSHECLRLLVRPDDKHGAVLNVGYIDIAGKVGTQAVAQWFGDESFDSTFEWLR